MIGDIETGTLYLLCRTALRYQPTECTATGQEETQKITQSMIDQWLINVSGHPVFPKIAPVSSFLLENIPGRWSVFVVRRYSSVESRQQAHGGPIHVLINNDKPTVLCSMLTQTRWDTKLDEICSSYEMWFKSNL